MEIVLKVGEKKLRKLANFLLYAAISVFFVLTLCTHRMDLLTHYYINVSSRVYVCVYYLLRIFFYKRNSIKKEKEIAEKVRVTKKLRSGGMLFSRRFSHFTYTSLQGIRHYLSEILKDIKDPMLLEILGYCQLTASEVFDHTRCIVSYYKQVMSKKSKIEDENEEPRVELSKINVRQLFTKTVHVEPIDSEVKKKLERVKINLDIDENVPNVIFAALSYFSKLANNIFSNAFKYTDQGKIDVHVGLAKNKENVLEYRVSDTGPGIPDETMKKLFVPYDRGAVRGKLSEKESFGVGMSIVEGIIEEMKPRGGSIDIDTITKGKNTGTTFTLHLPFDRVKKSSEDQQHGNGTSTNSPLDSPEIQKSIRKVKYLFIVDDNSINLSVFEKQYSVARNKLGLNFEVRTFSSGLECYMHMTDPKIHQEYKINPPIIVTDIDMPKMSGDELSKNLRKSFGDEFLVIHAITAALIPDPQNFKDTNKFDFFRPKPVYPSETFEDLEKLLFLWAMRHCSDFTDTRHDSLFKIEMSRELKNEVNTTTTTDEKTTKKVKKSVWVTFGQWLKKNRLALLIWGFSIAMMHVLCPWEWFYTFRSYTYKCQLAWICVQELVFFSVFRRIYPSPQYNIQQWEVLCSILRPLVMGQGGSLVKDSFFMNVDTLYLHQVVYIFKAVEGISISWIYWLYSTIYVLAILGFEVFRPREPFISQMRRDVLRYDLAIDHGWFSDEAVVFHRGLFIFVFDAFLTWFFCKISMSLSEAIELKTKKREESVLEELKRENQLHETFHLTVSQISHDLVNPSAGISTYFMNFLLLLKNTNPDKFSNLQKRYMIQPFMISALSLKHSIDNFLKTCKLRNGKIQHVKHHVSTTAIREMTDEILVECGFFRKKQNMQVVVKHDSNMQQRMRIKCDITNLRHMFKILIVNAFVHSQAENIEVSYGLSRRNRLGLGMWMKVSDDGVGIDSDIMEYLKAEDEALFQERYSHSLGLGLVLVTKLCVEIGGLVEFLESEEFSTSILLWVPVCDIRVISDVEYQRGMAWEKKKEEILRMKMKNKKKGDVSKSKKKKKKKKKQSKFNKWNKIVNIEEVEGEGESDDEGEGEEGDGVFSFRKLRVLAIDDNSLSLKVLEKHLETGGCDKKNIDIVETEEQFMHKLKTNRYDMIVCDYKLKKMNSYQLLMKLIDEGFQDRIPEMVVCVTGSATGVMNEGNIFKVIVSKPLDNFARSRWFEEMEEFFLTNWGKNKNKHGNNEEND